ncbi:MAG: hypothetical protein GX660_05935 [Clostridiaceae bacterium]|nr:hypothetical protein [Clostridiaceae bacterium]
MEKTKLGISVGLLGSALYFTGLLNYFALIILAGYVLIFEENEWLKKSAVKVVTIIIAFTIVSTLFSISNNILDILNVPLSWIRFSFRLSWPLKIDTIALKVLSILQSGILIILGFKALTQGTIKLGPIDKIIDKNI